MHKINKMQKSISIILLFIFLSARLCAIEGLHHASLFYEKNEKQLVPYIEIISEINPKTLGFVKTKIGQWQQQVIFQIDARTDTGDPGLAENIGAFNLNLPTFPPLIPDEPQSSGPFDVEINSVLDNGYYYNIQIASHLILNQLETHF